MNSFNKFADKCFEPENIGVTFTYMWLIIVVYFGVTLVITAPMFKMVYEDTVLGKESKILIEPYDSDYQGRSHVTPEEKYAIRYKQALEYIAKRDALVVEKQKLVEGAQKKTSIPRSRFPRRSPFENNDQSGTTYSPLELNSDISDASNAKPSSTLFLNFTFSWWLVAIFLLLMAVGLVAATITYYIATSKFMPVVLVKKLYNFIYAAVYFIIKGIYLFFVTIKNLILRVRNLLLN